MNTVMSQQGGGFRALIGVGTNARDSQLNWPREEQVHAGQKNSSRGSKTSE